MPRTLSANVVAPPPHPARPAGQPIIAVRALVHRYQDRSALNGVSFDVYLAELFGLLGPNGSGKTTLFRILSTLMVPTSGSATIAGFDAVRQPGALRRHIGVVLQSPSVDPGARRDLWQSLQILRDQERVSVIVTTHLMEEAEHCDRLAILNEGNLVALGTPEALTREIGGDVILLE